MTAAKVSREQVYAACDNIHSQAGTVTDRAVRRQLGDVGSATTIGRLIGEWRRQQEAGARPSLSSASEPFLERLQAIGSEIWLSAYDHALARLQADRSALEADRRALGDLQAEIDDLREDLAAAQRRIAELEAAAKPAEKPGRGRRKRKAEPQPAGGAEPQPAAATEKSPAS